MKQLISLAVLMFVASTPVKANKPAAVPPVVVPSDPLAATSGDWYDTRMRVKVTVTAGVAKITEIETSRPLPPPYKLGAIVGVLKSGKMEGGGRAYRFQGECIDPYGVNNAMMANCSTQMLSAYTDGKKVYMELKLWLLNLKRRQDFRPDEWAARR